VNLDLDKTHITTKLSVQQNGTYFIQVVDSKGYVNSNPIKNTIEAIPDNPPVIEIPAPGRESTCAPADALDMVIKVSDDYGIAQASLLAQINEGRPRR